MHRCFYINHVFLTIRALDVLNIQMESQDLDCVAPRD